VQISALLDKKEPIEDGLVRPYPEGARFLACSRAHIMRLMASGRLPYCTVGVNGGERRIRISALREFVDRNTVCLSGDSAPAHVERAPIATVSQ
jgi:excisionase family DNA binding protein